MRQAGRHLASYRALRKQYSFLEMCHEPELVAEVTQLPIKIYGMDAAILFSDILVVPEAMGVGLRFEDRLGPIIERPLFARSDIEMLPLPDLSKLTYVADSIRLLKKELTVPLIGFSGAPFTLASYMIEGQSSRDLKKTKKWMFKDPESFHLLLEKIADWSLVYLKMQIEAGVQAVQIFDSWANSLSHDCFREFSLCYLSKIVQGIKSYGVPVILFARGSSLFAPQLKEAGPAAISIDWNGSLPDIRRLVGPSVALQGNLDPDLLYAPLCCIEAATEKLLLQMDKDPGFIFNLGHGVPPDVSEDAVRTLVETVKKKRAS